MERSYLEVITGVVFFDGVCNLCNSSVNLLIRLDSNKRLRYSSLQGEYAKEKLTKELVETTSSVVFLKGDKIYIKSEAAVQILIQLGGVYGALGRVLSIFPYRFLNLFYNCIAKYRYKLFGKSKECRLPTSAEKTLFID